MTSSNTLKHVLLLCGGGSSEHDISLLSAEYLYNQLSKIEDIQIHYIEITKSGERVSRSGETCELRKDGQLVYSSSNHIVELNYVVPCIHGPPGETGEIQALFEMMALPYLGCGPEASMICFNKLMTKLMLDASNIPNTPYAFASSYNQEAITKAKECFMNWDGLFIKATNQGSSIGCYKVDSESEIENSLKEAFKYSSYVLFERPLKAREIEVSAYTINGELKVSPLGEIVCPNGFYTFEEKYDEESKTQTLTEVKDVSEEQVNAIQDMAKKAFTNLHLKDLARIDFFITDDNKIFLNEINTFPGMTPISMFPKLLEQNGDTMKNFLETKILSNAR